MAEATKGGRKPAAFECNAGSIFGTIWLNEDDKGQWYSVNISREYLDGEKQTKRANTFGARDLASVIEVARQCAEWIELHPVNDKKKR